MAFFRFCLNKVDKNKSSFKYILLGTLYFTQMLPMTFYFSGLPVIMRKSEYSLEQISYLGILGIPYAIKFLWAPYIDRGAGRRNHYKRIILFMTILYGITSIIASRINPETDLLLLMLVLSIGLTFLATQDIAVDAIATKMLSPAEQGIGNGLQSAGAFVGYLFGGGVMLMIFDKIGGWSTAVILLTSIVLVSLIPLLFYKEEESIVISRASFRDILSLFKNEAIIPPLMVALLCGSLLEVAYRKMRPLMVDAGFSTESIGLYMSIIGMSSGILVSLIFGILIKRKGLGTGFIWALIASVPAFVALMLAGAGYTSIPFLLAVVILGGGASGALHTASYTLFMRNGRKGSEGSDFTIQNALTFFALGFLGWAFGRFADHYGYLIMFMVTGLLFLITLIFSVKIFKKAFPKSPVDL